VGPPAEKPRAKGPRAEKPHATNAVREPRSPGKIWTPEEYLEVERQSLGRHEFSQGKVFAMAGGSRKHNLLVGNIVRLLGNALADRPCEAYPSDMRLKIPATGDYTYADVSAVCGRPKFDDQETDTLTNPQLIVEVLSRTTEANDRGRKFERYRSIGSFKEYLLVSQEQVLVEHFVRKADKSWPATEHRAGDSIKIVSLQCELAVDEIYLKVFDVPRADAARAEKRTDEGAIRTPTKAAKSSARQKR
jgi:Uma2 family endonuclease